MDSVSTHDTCAMILCSTARSGLLLDSEHEGALQQIRYLESKHQKTAEEELMITEAPAFGHKLKSLRKEEGQSVHFETTLIPVNDATMQVRN